MSGASPVANASARPPPAVRNPYPALEAGFDHLAPTYDEDIAENAVSQRMRDEFRKALDRAFPPGSFLFEIGCGTGIDAIWMARRGAEVVATDLSAGMIQEVKKKVARLGLGERVQVRRLSAAEIGKLAPEYGEGSFDGGYSHAGALNMEPNLAAVPAQIHSLLSDRGRFVCTVINRTSLFELLFYGLALRPRKAFRRLGGVLPMPVSRNPPLNHEVVPARFYTGPEVARMFRDGFEMETIRGLQIFLPPANLTEEYSTFRAAFRGLEQLEARSAGAPLLRLCGNHTLMVFRKA